jgi:hypothetical protein
MDRVEECVCCHEIPEVMNKNEEVFETDKLEEKLNCITDNPGFAGGCLNRWALQIGIITSNSMGQWQLMVLITN